VCCSLASNFQIAPVVGEAAAVAGGGGAAGGDLD